MSDRIRSYVKILQGFVDRVWYPPLLCILAAADNFIVVVPTDGILISSSMLNRHRWALFALSIAIGSTIGAGLLMALIQFQGMPWVLDLYPGLEQSKSWSLTMEFFQSYGLLVVFGVAITPLVQQPAVILAAAAGKSLPLVMLIIFVGRLLKFLLMAYVGSHAPRLLNKMWGLRGELRDAGVKTPD